MSKRRGWVAGSGQFLPEESFQRWGSYANALRQTGSRLHDRVFARSSVEQEITEVRARSGHEMKKNLNWWDLIWFGIGFVIVVVIFVITCFETKEVVGPAILFSFVVSGIFAFLVVFSYTKFAVEMSITGKKLFDFFFLLHGRFCSWESK